MRNLVQQIKRAPHQRPWAFRDCVWREQTLRRRRGDRLRKSKSELFHFENSSGNHSGSASVWRTEWQALRLQLTPISHYPEALELDGEDLFKIDDQNGIALVAKLERSATRPAPSCAKYDAINGGCSRY